MDLTDPENDQNFQVRVRFLNNLGRDYYVQINECRRLNSSLDFQHCLDIHPRDIFEKHMAREREIFLRASLQLLDQQDAQQRHTMETQSGKMNHPNKDFPSSSSSGHPHGNVRQSSTSQANTMTTSGSNKADQNENTMYDVIRLGFLKKAKAGAFGNNHNHHHHHSHHIHWKKKYVELRHGLFTYDDLQIGGNTTLYELANGDQSNLSTRRSIPLSFDQTICQVYKNPNPQYQDDSVLEISTTNGTKRLWMAASPEEGQEWIRAIHSAMLGNPSSSKSLNSTSSINVLASVVRDIDSSISYQSGGNNSDNNSGNSNDSNTNHSNNNNNNSNTQDMPRLKRQNSRELFEAHAPNSHRSKSGNWLSIDGAAAPYAHDMSHFLNMQHEFCTEDLTESRYRQLLHHIYTEHVKITIPVLFIKVSLLCDETLFFHILILLLRLEQNHPFKFRIISSRFIKQSICGGQMHHIASLERFAARYYRGQWRHDLRRIGSRSDGRSFSASHF